jgi:hypothetical protein
MKKKGKKKEKKKKRHARRKAPVQSYTPSSSNYSENVLMDILVCVSDRMKKLRIVVKGRETKNGFSFKIFHFLFGCLGHCWSRRIFRYSGYS